jgi:hypothetical protein
MARQGGRTYEREIEMPVNYLARAKALLDSAYMALDRGKEDRAEIDCNLAIAAALIAIAENTRPQRDIDPEEL